MAAGFIFPIIIKNNCSTFEPSTCEQWLTLVAVGWWRDLDLEWHEAWRFSECLNVLAHTYGIWLMILHRIAIISSCQSTDGRAERVAIAWLYCEAINFASKSEVPFARRMVLPGIMNFYVGQCSLWVMSQRNGLAGVCSHEALLRPLGGGCVVHKNICTRFDKEVWTVNSNFLFWLLCEARKTYIKKHNS
jgi:hypothetical protein